MVTPSVNQTGCEIEVWSCVAVIYTMSSHPWYCKMALMNWCNLKIFIDCQQCCSTCSLKKTWYWLMFEQFLKGKGVSRKDVGAPPCGNNLLEACFFFMKSLVCWPKVFFVVLLLLLLLLSLLLYQVWKSVVSSPSQWSRMISYYRFNRSNISCILIWGAVYMTSVVYFGIVLQALNASLWATH